jgi:hypothetical protein
MAVPVRVGCPRPYVYGETAIGSISIPASASTSTWITASFSAIETPGSVTSFTLPNGLQYVITDIFVAASQSVDGLIRFIKNGIKVMWQGALNTLLVSNPSRPRAPILVYFPYDILSIQFLPATSPSAATTDTFYFSVEVYNCTFSSG